MDQPKILLVDDVEFFLEVEKSFLGQTPATLLTARNGREALETARRERPNVIFMDVNMPVMDGLTCCRLLKSDPTLSRVPVIMVFAPSKELGVDACRAAGCDGALTKPLDRHAFLEMGHRFLFHIERREKRHFCELPVEFRLEGRTVPGWTVDLSEHGMYIRTREELAPEQRLRIVLPLPAPVAKTVELTGRVTWTNQGFPRPNLGMPQGFGVEFQLMSAATAALLRQFLDHFPSGGQK